MIRLAIILSILFFSVQSVPYNWDEKIVGGSNAKDGDAPYQVSLRSANNPSFHFCGASIISEKWLLTACHCTINKGYWEIYAVVGSVINNPTGKMYALTKVINHPQYDPERVENDISLLQV